MFHCTNGRSNFDPFNPVIPFSEMPDRETLIKILKRENELRLSKEVQEEFWYDILSLNFQVIYSL